MGLYVGDKAVKKILNGDNAEINHVSTKDKGVYPKTASETVTFNYTGADQHWTAPESGKLTIECWGAGAISSAGGYAKGTIQVLKGDKFSIVCGSHGNNGGTYGFNGTSNYSGAYNGGGLAGVFTGDAAVADTDAARALVIGGGAGAAGRYGAGGVGGGENGGNGGAGGGCGGPGYGGTQTAKGGGAQRGGQFHGGGPSGTYGSGGGAGWYGGGGNTGDGSGWDDQSAGGGSGYVVASATDRVLTAGAGSGNSTHGKVVLTFVCEPHVPSATYVTQAGIYHNPDLGLISMSSDGENWVTIADKNVGATSYDPTDQNSYGKTFQYGNIYGFPGEGDSTAITTSSAIPSLSGYEGGNLYSDSTYRTNMSWLGRNTNLWKGIAFTNLKSLEKGPCPLGFHVPTKAEFEDVIDVLQSIIGEEEEITLETLETYFLMSHPKVRKGSGSFSTDYIDSIYGTLDVELDHDIELFGGRSLSPGLSSGGTILGFLGFRIHQYSESSALSIEMGAGLANTSMYIRPFRDKAMIPTTEWTRLSPGGHARLPHEYQEVEYIQSDGNAYINTGFIPKAKTEFDMTIEPYSYVGTYCTIMGTRVSTSANAYRFGYYAAQDRCYIEFSPTNTDPVGLSWRTLGQKYDISYHNKVITDGTNQITVSHTQDCTLPLFLFTGNNNGAAAEPSSLKLYQLKLYEDGVTIHDYVPCYRIADGIIGLYDLVEGKFYTNAGTGTFKKGAPINVWTMPSGYTELAYIGTTGSQFIDTGLSPTSNLQVESGVRTNSTAANAPVFGNYINDSSSYTSGNYYHLTAYSSKFYRGLNGSESNGGSYSHTAGNRYYLVYNDSSNNVIENGSVIGSSSGTTGYPGTTIAMARRGSNNGSYYGQYEYYYFKIYDKTQGKYVCDFVPCVRDSDGVIGMYDLVTKQFFTNSGTGDFVAGPIVMRDGFKLSANTIAHLLLNGNTDYEGSGISGTNPGSDITYESVSGDIQAIRFKGNTNSFLGLTGVPEMNTDFTIGFWIKQYSAGTAQIFVERGTSDSTNCDLHYIMRDTNKIDLGFYANDCAGNTAISASTWYHLCATYKYSTREMKTYINAVADGTLTGSGNPSFGTGPLYLGCKKSFASNSPSNAAMSDFFRENKVWTQEQIQQYVRGVEWKY